MKKLLLSAMALIASVSASFAQLPNIFTEVEENVYAITTSQDDINATFDATKVEAAWSIGVWYSAGDVMLDNDYLTVSATVDNSPAYTANGYLSDVQTWHPTYTGYINMGSTLDQTFGDSIIIEDVAGIARSGQAIVTIAPKVAGTLTVEMYAGNNRRCAGIWENPTDEEWDADNIRGWAVLKTWRHGPEADSEWEDDDVAYDSSLEKSPKELTCTVDADHEYYVIAGSNRNQALAQITFVPDETASSSDANYVLGEAEDNVYALIDSASVLSEKFAAYDYGSGNLGLPAGTVLYENDEVSISATLDDTRVYTSWAQRLSDIQSDHPGYYGAINMGSTLNQNFGDSIVIEDVAGLSRSGQSIVTVEPKVDGTLTAQIYCGDNNRTCGIWEVPTDEEWDADEIRGWAALETWRHGSTADEWVDDDVEFAEGLANTPKDITGTVTAGRTYYIIAGSNRNLSLAEITFVPADSETGVADIAVSEAASKTIVAYYSIDGKQISQPQSGVTIVKYSDGSSIKVVK